jgi:hypothetical protein
MQFVFLAWVHAQLQTGAEIEEHARPSTYQIDYTY